MRLLSLSVIGMFLFVGISYPVRGQQPPAENIMGQMASTYATCHSYVDEGEVRTVFLQQNGRRWTQVKPFSTAFVRPWEFRFEYKSRRGEDEWDALRHLAGRGNCKDLVVNQAPPRERTRLIFCARRGCRGIEPRFGDCATPARQIRRTAIGSSLFQL